MEEPPHPLNQMIAKYFKDYSGFQTEFTNAALSVFGSGYAWLVADAFGRLLILTSANQDCPLSENLFPLLNLDVWEHAYYIDYRNERPGYLEHFWALVNWEFVAKNLAA